MAEPRQWTIWRIERGSGAEVWQGAEGPPTNPPGDLVGEDWIEAAKVRVVEVREPTSGAVEAVADALDAVVALEDEDGKPAPREHYMDLARRVFLELASTGWQREQEGLGA